MNPSKVCGRRGCETALVPPKRSDALWCSEACRKAAKRAARADAARTSKPSGAQVSFVKTKRALTAEFAALGLSDPAARAHRLLLDVLSVRQRDALSRSLSSRPRAR